MSRGRARLRAGRRAPPPARRWPRSPRPGVPRPAGCTSGRPPARPGCRGRRRAARGAAAPAPVRPRPPGAVGRRRWCPRCRRRGRRRAGRRGSTARCCATRPRPVLLDVVYAPWPTALAASLGARDGGDVVGGFEMLLHQAAEQARFHDRPATRRSARCGPLALPGWPPAPEPPGGGLRPGAVTRDIRRPRPGVDARGLPSQPLACAPAADSNTCSSRSTRSLSIAAGRCARRLRGPAAAPALWQPGPGCTRSWRWSRSRSAAPPVSTRPMPVVVYAAVAGRPGSGS